MLKIFATGYSSPLYAGLAGKHSCYWGGLIIKNYELMMGEMDAFESARFSVD
jgi:hypothetical protein